MSMAIKKENLNAGKRNGGGLPAFFPGIRTGSQGLGHRESVEISACSREMDSHLAEKFT